jgi:hypothetical protein
MVFQIESLNCCSRGRKMFKARKSPMKFECGRLYLQLSEVGPVVWPI